MKQNPEYKTAAQNILKIEYDNDFNLIVTETRLATDDEVIAETTRNVKLKKLLERCDFWLAHLEDYTKGEAGDEITELRADIQHAINQ